MVIFYIAALEKKISILRNELTATKDKINDQTKKAAIAEIKYQQIISEMAKLQQQHETTRQEKRKAAQAKHQRFQAEYAKLKKKITSS